MTIYCFHTDKLIERGDYFDIYECTKCKMAYKKTNYKKGTIT